MRSCGPVGPCMKRYAPSVRLYVTYVNSIKFRKEHAVSRESDTHRRVTIYSFTIEIIFALLYYVFVSSDLYLRRYVTCPIK